MPVPTVLPFSSTASGTGSFTLTWPTGHQNNDIGLLFIERSGSDSDVDITSPSGWANIQNNVSVLDTTGTRIQIFWKRAVGSSEAIVTIPDGGNHQLAAMIVVRGCVTTGTPYSTTQSGSAFQGVTTITHPVNSIQDWFIPETNTLGIYSVCEPTDSLTDQLTLTTANGWTEFGTGFRTTAGNGGGIYLFTQEFAQAQSPAPRITVSFASSTNGAISGFAMLGTTATRRIFHIT